MPKLSVIIPVYQEPVRMIRKAVNSITAQTAYNPDEVEIILACDLPDRKLHVDGCMTVPCEVNAGPGVARQRGVDAAAGEWVTFLDADDIYFNLLAFQQFYNVLADVPDADFIRFPILEESEMHTFHPKAIDSTWCFSKFFRRAFLREHGIAFSHYRVHEDSYFVRLCEQNHPKIVDHSDTILCWRYNPESTVRRDDGIYWQTSFPTYIDVLYTLMRKRAEQGDGDTIGEQVYNFTYCFAIISRMDEQYRNESITALRKWLHEDDIKLLGTMQDRIAGDLKRIDALDNTPIILPKLTLEQFLKLLEV